MRHPGMSQYRIRLGNPWQMHYRWSELEKEVAALFRPAIVKNGHFGSVNVVATMDKPTMMDHELLIYVIPMRGFGMARRADDTLVPEAAGLSVDLLNGRGFCNEVYVSDELQEVVGGDKFIFVEGLTPARRLFVTRKVEPACLAMSIYHEALHCKTNLSADRLHNFPPREPFAIRSATIDCFQSQQTPTDIDVMARHLMKRRVQWTGGWDVLPKPT